MDRDVWAGAEHAYYPELANVRFYADAADAFNAEPRTCAKCGAAQPRFPHGADGLAALRAVRRAGQPRARQHRSGGAAQEAATMALERKKTLNVFKDAPARLGLVRRVSRSGPRAPTRCRT